MRWGLLAAVHRTARARPSGADPRSDQLSSETVSRTLPMMSSGTGA